MPVGSSVFSSRAQSPVVYGSGVQSLFSVGNACFSELEALSELQGFGRQASMTGSRAASPAVFATGLRRLLSLSRQQYSDLTALSELADGLPPIPNQGISILNSIRLPHHSGLAALHLAAEPGLEVVFTLQDDSLEGLSKLKFAFESETPKRHSLAKSSSFAKAPTPPLSKTSSRAPSRQSSKADATGGRSSSGLPPVGRKSELYFFDKNHRLKKQPLWSEVDTPRNEDNEIANDQSATPEPSGVSLPPITGQQAHVAQQPKVKLTFIQSVVAREGKLRNELASIQLRTSDREKQRKLRQEKKKSTRILPPLHHKDATNATTGRGKLLFDICMRYKTRIR
eukprot:TRINITY_DN16327_c0_g1_i2.p1 TRINITY_DN16327_c0_g1~~TRINITY_DN16327_c0_g1_i2.p1  ORF type:complete len:356 (+),score=59.36 TRINITY_DN16327_c0_g1_i2:49-1068(+)